MLLFNLLNLKNQKYVHVIPREKISSGQPILRVAIAQLATYKMYLARCLKCQSRSEHIKFNYVESSYSLKISFRMILCLSSLQLDVKSGNLQTVTKNSSCSSNYALTVKYSRWNSKIVIISISIKISK